uniref:Uncharacterized protein n=1 Tax=Chromera velia CCMP2878 TaxID=1169474 RepID=A0A0G4HGS5_9ALVE|eukprot:Cvel_27427.t1-p1 / transcript=Cvel_27427.t1 / gene=Cvel_27427 / organism=Chromera_velia_CCMP2878 / gene_product=hypothetical protein / transcript_product=hypothetical protein / location=Cvel_scaffold3420:13777-14961(-) / protein_length=146 / sequence_SO=supercontig / SO=protein_coding / is_pseudo=false
MEIRRTGRRETATIRATLLPGRYRDHENSSHDENAGRRNNRDGRARGAAPVEVGLAAAATATVAGAAALSSGNPTPTRTPPTRMTLQPAIQPTQGLQQALQATLQQSGIYGIRADDCSDALGVTAKGRVPGAGICQTPPSMPDKDE